MDELIPFTFQLTLEYCYRILHFGVAVYKFDVHKQPMSLRFCFSTNSQKILGIFQLLKNELTFILILCSQIFDLEKLGHKRNLQENLPPSIFRKFDTSDMYGKVQNQLSILKSRYNTLKINYPVKLKHTYINLA